MKENNMGGILFLIQLGKVSKAGRGWLPSGATKGDQPSENARAFKTFGTG